MDAPALRACYREIRARTRVLLDDVLAPEAYYERPIALRHPFVFYDGHLPGFALNTLVKWALGRPGIDPGLEDLFARGIDPADEAKAPAGTAWPARERVRAFVAAAEAAVEDAFGAPAEHAVLATGTILEHELMHQETLAYMLHRVPLQRLRPQGPALRLQATTAARGQRATIPAGRATLGARPGDVPFGWDNEFPRHVVEVPAFEVDVLPVTNAEYLEFVDAGAAAPLGWSRQDDGWRLRTFFDEVALPPDWPAYVSHAEATAYCRFRGRRLMTEAEFHRAAYGTPSGDERPHPWGGARPEPGRHGNFGFVSWDPWPVGSCSEGASAFGVLELVGNGWEWTSTPFAPFPGFAPMPSYPAYSADFFDGAHIVLKGASALTDASLVRRSFRNWYRAQYPYPFAKFRTVNPTG